MTRSAIRFWYLVHKWTSLICTLFLLMLCVTGLPLIFHEEIDHAIEAPLPLADLPADTPLISLDRITENVLQAHPGDVGLYLSFDDDRPIVYMTSAQSPQDEDAHFTSADARTGEIIPRDEGFDLMHFILELHADMFLGLGGMLFLGLMGLLFCIAIASGVVIYAPFMRKLDFGEVRRSRSPRVKWLDLHNLLGVVTLAWALVVGFTGVINTLSVPIMKLWQADELAEMIAPYKGQPRPEKLASLDAAVKTARKAAQGMEVEFVAFPGTLYTSEHHYGVFMHGNTPLTSKILKPALIDAVTGELSDMRSLPWYAKALLLSQPLHFGDYGGMPLKILWAALDIITIIVLGSGLYLWLGRRKTSLDLRLNEIEAGGAGNARAGAR